MFSAAIRLGKQRSGLTHAGFPRLLAVQTVYDWLLFLPVLAGMIWVGGGVMLAAVGSRVVRDAEPRAVARCTGSLRVLRPLALAPAAIAVHALGIGLVLDSDADSEAS